METSMLFVLVVLICSIAFILRNHHKNRIRFERKIAVLENIIAELTKKIKDEEKKVKLSNDIKTTLKKANEKLGQSILELNTNLLDELFNKKK